MRAFVLLAFLLPLVPTAAAGPFVCEGAFVAFACAGEWTWGDCSSSGYEGDGAFVGSLAGAAWVEGSSYCEAGPDGFTYEDHGVFVGASTLAGTAAVAWYESTSASQGDSFTRCSTVVHVEAAGEDRLTDAGCPAGAPQDPDWGHVLP